jgi:hypothetical protein
MLHLVEEPELFDATKDFIKKTISPFGFSWNDVQDVMPVYDCPTFLVSTVIMDSWNFKFAMLAKALDKKVSSSYMVKSLLSD